MLLLLMLSQKKRNIKRKEDGNPRFEPPSWLQATAAGELRKKRERERHEIFWAIIFFEQWGDESATFVLLWSSFAYFLSLWGKRESSKQGTRKKVLGITEYRHLRKERIKSLDACTFIHIDSSSGTIGHFSAHSHAAPITFSLLLVCPRLLSYYFILWHISEF